MSHTHVLYDSDPHFKIDPISRKITNISSTKTTLIQHDHNSERFTFECPRYVEGHDLSLCDIVEVHYLNIESNTKNVTGGVYTVDDLQIMAGDDNTVVCSWRVSANATRFVGQLQFLLRFACTNDEAGKIEYVWNTAIYSGITISQGIYNGNAESDNPIPAYNFVTTITGDVLKFFVGTQAQYDKLSFNDKQNLFAIITDDKTKEELFAELERLKNIVDGMTDGDTVIADVLSGDVEATFDANGGGFRITEAGVYLLIGFTGADSYKNWYRDIIAIPDVTNFAYGSSYGEEKSYSYYSATTFNGKDEFDWTTYRLRFHGDLGITPYKAIKIMNL